VWLHLRWGTFIPNSGTLGLWVLELFAIYAADARTDRRTDRQKQRYCPLPHEGAIILAVMLQPGLVTV